jgi:hypothetical protein
MAASAPKSSAGDDRNLVTIDENYLAPTFEDRLQIFWEKNARTVTAVIVIIALALIGRWLFGVFAAQRERAVQTAYAAATNTEQLKAFIAENPRASLSGVASLRIADEAYAAGNFTAARDAYLAAAPLLVGNPLASRARLGAAVSPLLAGDAAAAKTALDVLANDTTLIAGVRAEAAYHLAVLARDAGQTAEATRLTGVVLSVDPEGMWAQRALQLRSSLPPEPAPVVTPAVAPAATTESAVGATPAVAFPASK